MKQESDLEEVYKGLTDKNSIFKNNIEMHSRLIDSIPQAIIVLEHTKILFINRYALELFKIDTPNEFLGMNILNFLHFEPPLFDIKKENIFKITTKKGNIIEVCAKFSPIDNNIILIVFEDRSEINRLKEEQEKSKKNIEMAMKWNKQLIDIIPEAVFMHDGKNVIFANAASKKLLKIKDDSEIIGKSIFEIVHPDYHALEKARCEILLKKNDNVSAIEEKLVLKDGRIIDVEVVGASIEMKEEIIAIDAVRDITYRKKNEILKNKIEKKQKLLKEAEEHERLINEFLSNISHELKTPLNLIMATQQLLNVSIKRSDESNPSICNYMNILKRNSYRLLRLINNLLDITEMNIGCYRVNFNNFDIGDVVEEIIDPVRDYLNGEEIKFSSKINIKNLKIACDKNEIQRAILNIISNAIKFTEPGGSIDVLLDRTEKSIRISVKDTGCGIDKDKLEVIFNALRQEDKSFTRANEGSGLGLAIAEHIVKIHGGKIKVESEQGKGSKFTIYLPVKKVTESDLDYSVSKVDNFYNVSPKEKVNIEFSDIIF